MSTYQKSDVEKLNCIKLTLLLQELKQGPVIVEDELIQLQRFASHLRSGIGEGTTETNGSNNPFVDHSNLHETVSIEICFGCRLFGLLQFLTLVFFFQNRCLVPQ